jgi:hypothetical protein
MAHNSIPPKWTVVFIVHAVDDQSRYYSEQLFTELLQAKSSPDVRVFVLRNTYDYFDNINTHARLWEIQSEPPRIKRAIPDLDTDGLTKMEAGKQNEDENSFGDMNLNLGNEETLKNILKRIRKEVGEESKILLFTWDHGSGFGIFNSEEFDYDTAPPVKSAPKTDMLMMSELGNAIRDSFGKIQMLIMMNCWMQSIETNMQLKGCTDVLIAAETTIDWIGYDYIKIINTLISEPEIDLLSFAEQIIDDTIEKYKQPPLKDVRLDKIIFTATKPNSQELETLAGEINNIARVLEPKEIIHQTIEAIIKARSDTEELTFEFGGGGRPWCFVDILDVFTRLTSEELIEKIPEFNELKTNLDKIEKIFKVDQANRERFIIKKHIGDHFTKEKPGHYGGVSICFPNNKGFLNCNFYKNFYLAKRISFAQKAPEWPSFTKWALDEPYWSKNKRDKYVSFGLKGKITANSHGVKFEPADGNEIQIENENGEMQPDRWMSEGLKKINDVTIAIKADLFIVQNDGKDVNQYDVHVNSLEIDSPSIINNKHLFITVRGAGDGKTHGPSDHKTHGPGLLKMGLEQRFGAPQ